MELNVDPIHWATVNAVQELYGRCEDTRIEQNRRLASVEANNAAKDKEIAALKVRANKAEQENAAIRDRLERLEKMLK